MRLERIIGTVVIAIGALASTAEAQDEQTFPLEEAWGKKEAIALPLAGPQAAGSFQIVPQANTGNVWVINTLTGALRLCLPPRQDQVPATAEFYEWGDTKR